MGSPFTVLGAKIFAGLSLTLLLCAAGLALWGRAESQRADRWEVQANAEGESHRQTKANYTAAQKQAADKARDARLATERQLARIAKEADDANEDADRWRAAARRFADAGGLQGGSGSALAGSRGAAGTCPEDRLAQGGDGPGGAAVLLSRAAFDTLTDNTDRLLRVHAWGDRLIADGLALRVPAP